MSNKSNSSNGLGLGIVLATLLAISTTYSQCYKPERNYNTESNFGLVVNVGSLKSLGGEIFVRYKGHIIGGGLATNVNGVKEIQQQFKNKASYFTYGYQYTKYTLGVRYGRQNSAIWTDANTKTTINNLTMIGGYVGYNLNTKVAINVGYDTFSQATIGLVMGLHR